MADLKITELAALTTVLGEDLLAIVDDPTGTASTKKIRTDDFQSTWHVGARVYNNADISVANASPVALTFNSERFDTDTIHSTGTNTGRLTCNTAGKYLIIGTVQYDANATGERMTSIKLGGATFLGRVRSIANTIGGSPTVHNIAIIYELAATNYVELFVYQTSGDALDVKNEQYSSPEFMMHRIG